MTDKPLAHFIIHEGGTVEQLVHTQRVGRVGGEWMGTCDHGETVWCIFRGTEHNAWRSLRAHAAECRHRSPGD